MGLGGKTYMIMHRPIWSDDDQSSRRRLKVIEITKLEEHVWSYGNVVLYIYSK